MEKLRTLSIQFEKNCSVRCKSAGGTNRFIIEKQFVVLCCGTLLNVNNKNKYKIYITELNHHRGTSIFSTI